MLCFDQEGAERVLLQLEGEGVPGTRHDYRFTKKEGHLCLLGTGATSYVYEMEDAAVPDRHYALKVIGLSGETADPEEVRLTAQIQYHLSEQSGYIARVIELWLMKIVFDENGNVVTSVGVDDPEYEATEGLPLQMILMDKLEHILGKDKFGNVELFCDGLLTENGVIELGKQIGRALLTIHGNGFLHRDIKLENIFRNPETSCYQLGDFGVSRYVDDGNAETVLFTDGYGAPEIEKRLRESYDATADIYSYGITLYLLLNDLRFPGSDAYHASAVQYEHDFIPPAPAHASERMAMIVRKMCSYLPEDRYHSAEEVLMELGRTDGTYTERGFSEEDAETEVYAEQDTDDAGSTLLSRVFDAMDRGAPLTREKRIKVERVHEDMYRDSSRDRVIYFTLLFFALFKALSPQASYAREWSFLILPAALIVLSVLQRVGEFRAEAALFCIGAVIFSIRTSGIDVPQLTLIPVVLLGVPAISAGCGIGIALWILQTTTGKWTWLGFLGRWDLGWLVFLAVIGATESFVRLRREQHRTPTPGESVLIRIIDHLWFVPLLFGIVLCVLEKKAGLVIPDPIRHLHPIRCGIGIPLIHFFYLFVYEPLPLQNVETEQ